MNGAIVQEEGVVPVAVELTLREAHEKVVALMSEGVSYAVMLSDEDGQVFRRFSRTLPYEVWIVAYQLRSDGQLAVGADCLVCPISFSPALLRRESKETAEKVLRDELAALERDRLAA